MEELNDEGFEGLGDGSNNNNNNKNSNKNKKKKKSFSSRSPFAALGLSAAAAAAAQKQLGFSNPTPIQRAAIPLLLQRRDAILLARTGSGKTAAYLLPLIDFLQAHSSTVGVRGLIIAPTRELIQQIYNIALKINKHFLLNISQVIGGVDLQQQFELLSTNPDLLLATPGRLLQLLQENLLQLSAAAAAVIDEADRLLETGWEQQLHLILSYMPLNKQSVLVSATLPEQLVALSSFALKDPAFIKIDNDKKLPDKLNIKFIFARNNEKIATLLALLNPLHQVR